MNNEIISRWFKKFDTLVCDKCGSKATGIVQDFITDGGIFCDEHGKFAAFESNSIKLSHPDPWESYEYIGGGK